MSNLRDQIRTLVSEIVPCDTLEQEQQRDVLAWIDSGEELHRIRKPDSPPMHLVSYFVLLDRDQRQILLVDHIKAQLWLPGGGHVDPGEHPDQTALREFKEELGIEGSLLMERPLFISVTTTTGITVPHVDVSLWYVFDGDCSRNFDYDQREFASIQWFSLDAIPYERTDPHMKRFVAKLETHVFHCSQVLKGLEV